MFPGISNPMYKGRQKFRFCCFLFRCFMLVQIIINGVRECSYIHIFYFIFFIHFFVCLIYYYSKYGLFYFTSFFFSLLPFIFTTLLVLFAINRSNFVLHTVRMHLQTDVSRPTLRVCCIIFIYTLFIDKGTSYSYFIFILAQLRLIQTSSLSYRLRICYESCILMECVFSIESRDLLGVTLHSYPCNYCYIVAFLIFVISSLDYPL